MCVCLVMLARMCVRVCARVCVCVCVHACVRVHTLRVCMHVNRFKWYVICSQAHNTAQKTGCNKILSNKILCMSASVYGEGQRRIMAEQALVLLSSHQVREPKHFLKQIDSAISVLLVREPTNNMLYVVYIRRTCMGLANACLAVNSQH